MFVEPRVVVAVVFSTGGGFIMLIGLGLLVKILRFLRTAASARATMVGHETRVGEVDGCAASYAHPVVEFVDLEGSKRCVTISVGTYGFSDLPNGSQVEIVFNPQDPEEAYVRHFVHLWLLPLVVMGLGFGLLMFGLLAFFSR